MFLDSRLLLHNFCESNGTEIRMLIYILQYVTLCSGDGGEINLAGTSLGLH